MRGKNATPPTAGSCSKTCEAIVCGDGILDEGEQCEPALSEELTCTDTCTTLSEQGTEYLYTFDSDVQDWTIYTTSPERLLDDSSLRYDAQNGDISPGCLRVQCPFDASNQKIEFQSTPNTILDLTGRVLRMRVRLESGLSDDAVNPGGVKIFAKSGDNWNYASGDWTYLAPKGGWTEVTLDSDRIVLDPTQEFAPSEVRQFGLELRTFELTQGVSTAVIYVDSVSY